MPSLRRGSPAGDRLPIKGGRLAQPASTPDHRPHHRPGTSPGAGVRPLLTPEAKLTYTVTYLFTVCATRTLPGGFAEKAEFQRRCWAVCRHGFSLTAGQDPRYRQVAQWTRNVRIAFPLGPALGRNQREFRSQYSVLSTRYSVRLFRIRPKKRNSTHLQCGACKRA